MTDLLGVTNTNSKGANEAHVNQDSDVDEIGS
jgi:hypothetical protein